MRDPLPAEELVLSLLVDYVAEHVPGEVLSGKLGLPAEDVYRGVEGLRELGYRVDSSPRGFCLRAIPDRLTRLELTPLLSTRDLGSIIHSFDEIPSTNDRAMELGREGAAHGEVVIAERQTAGKGRRGRSWVSPPGVNLHLSVILRPQLPAVRAPELTLLAAVALAETLRDAGVKATIKWPNDVVIGGRKLAGILTELSSDGDRVGFVVLGFGVNLNCLPAELPEELREIATSARAVLGEVVPRALFTAALLTKLEQLLESFDEEGFAPVRERWRELSATLGKKVRIADGAPVVEGEALDIDETGALLVRGADGVVQRVLAGDVTESPGG